MPLTWLFGYLIQRGFRGKRKQGINALVPFLKPLPKAAKDLIKLSIMGFKSKTDTFKLL